MQNPLYVEVSSTVRYRMPATNLSPERIKYNRNALIATSESTAYYNQSARGLNAGMTNEGGYCAATFATYDGFTYLCVVMGAREDEAGTVYSYELINRLLRWCRKTFAVRELIPAGKSVCTVPVSFARPNRDGDKNGIAHLRVVTADSAEAYLSLDLNEENGLAYHYILHENALVAPMEAGTVIGRYYCTLDGKELAAVDLVLKDSATRDEFLYGLEQIKQFCFSRGFLAFAVSFALLLLLDRVVLPRTRRPIRRR
jgi:D-alanyl-D-alanine carboxypeptidase (penicillin-binding protein 5/6)